MSGYIGGILILSGCFMYGLSYSQRLKNRITILKDMVRMLSVMNNHIGYSLIDMTQIFERLGDFDMCSYVRDFTGYIYEALNKSDIESPDTEDDDDELPEGFEIEDEYETVHIEEKAAGGEFAVTSESVAEPEISDDYTVEEVEAGFEIEEMETEDENLDISADDVPLFKERDRH